MNCHYESVQCMAKCPTNHYSPVKYNTIRPHKLHFLENSPLVQLWISASDYQGVGNIPGSHFVKDFSALPSHS